MTEKAEKYFEDDFNNCYDTLVKKLYWIDNYKKDAKSCLKVIKRLIECQKEINPIKNLQLKSEKDKDRINKYFNSLPDFVSFLVELVDLQLYIDGKNINDNISIN